MKPNPRLIPRSRAAFLAALTLLPMVHAQSVEPTPAPAAAGADDKSGKGDALVMEAFVTTGSNIKRLDQENTLPVTVFSMSELQTRDSATPMDLLIGIPEVTNIPANETSTNAVAARGDNANVALRGLGTVNTLVLLNGRRMPAHPLTSSAVNVNTLPTFGLQQVEVLRDGASAIYGSDAVAGVINYVTDPKPHGAMISQRFGVTQHGGGMDEKLDIGFGKSFADGRGSMVFSYSGYARDEIGLWQRAFSANTNRLQYARAPWNAPGQTAYDGSTTIGQWAQIIPGASTSNTATIQFYPLSGNPNDTPSLNNLTTNPLPKSLYANYNQSTVGQPRSWRNNVYDRVEYELTPSIKVFAEGLVYFSRSVTGRQPITLNSSDSRVFLGIDNPFNPYGSHFYNATGAPNSDGSSRLVGTPQQTTIAAVFLTDGGNERITSVDSSYRFVTGVEGKIGNSSWKWQAGLMSGGVYANDESTNAVRDSYLRAAALRSDATAWNPFGWTFKVANGAVVANQPYTNPASVRNSYTVSANRFGHNKLDNADFSLTGNVIDLWAGPIAASTGVQWLYQYNEEHKDPYVGFNGNNIGGDGQPLNPVDNDILVTSPKFPYAAGREIPSAYAETEIPVIAPKNNLIWTKSLNLNAAVRYEHYSDFGGTTKPKFGGDWRPLSWLMFRGSINEGFRAPLLSDLYQPTSFSVATPPGVRDAARQTYLFSEAGLANDAQFLTKTYSLANPTLRPEQSNGRSIGTVIDIPYVKGLSLSIDYWEIKQKQLIITQTTTSGLDEQLLRSYTQAQLAAGQNILNINVGQRITPDDPVGGYHGDPFELRNAVTPADVALFQPSYAKLPQSQWIAPLGTPVGSISQLVNSTGNNFTNGLDYALGYNLPKTPFGQFRLQHEWSEFLNKFTKSFPGAPKNDDVIAMLVPKWKNTTTLQWRNGGWDASVNMVYETQVRTGNTATAAQFTSLNAPNYIKPVWVYATNGSGVLNYYEKGDSQTQINTSVAYRFGSEAPKWLRRVQVRVGCNNITDAQPGRANTASSGYAGGTGSSLWIGRAFSFTTSKEF